MFDIIFENASVIDGSGAEPYTSDVGVTGERISDIGDLSGAKAESRIDAAGRTLCPGFIDAHSHADLAYFMEDCAQVLNPLIRQGITTFVGGNCGIALAPITRENVDGLKLYLEIFTQMDFDASVRWDSFASFLDFVDTSGSPLNCAMLAPHGMMRISSVGLETRLARPEEISAMRRSLTECMEAGAFGLSTGLQYFPGNQSDTAELCEVAGALTEYDGVFTSHLRSYSSNTIPQAMDEVAEVARRNDIRAQVSHIFSVPWFGPFQRPGLAFLKWLTRHPGVSSMLPRAAVEGEMRAILRHLAKINEGGAQVGMDAMPTTAGFSHLFAFFPSWALTGGREAVLKRVADRTTRSEILSDILKGRPDWPHRGKNDWSLNIMKQLGWDAVTVMAVHSEKNRELEGRLFTDIASERGMHPFDVMCDLLLEEDGRVLVFESLAEPDDPFTEGYMFPAIADPNTMIVTDAILLGLGKPSYLFYGCYPKLIGRYVYDRGILELAEAIRKSTSLPAEWFGIKDRGLVREGYFADLLLMRPEEFRSEAVFRDPERYPEGLDLVLINGKPAIDGEGMRAEALPGKMLRRSDR